MSWLMLPNAPPIVMNATMRCRTTSRQSASHTTVRVLYFGLVRNVVKEAEEEGIALFPGRTFLEIIQEKNRLLLAKT